VNLALSLLPVTVGIARLPAGSSPPDWIDWSDPLVSVSRTDDEFSVICPEERIPEGVTCEKGWRVFKVAGPLEISLTGILFSLLTPLAEAGIPILALSTYDTDYVLVGGGSVSDAATALRRVAQVAPTAAP
jgi:hypothetical protein